MDSSESADNTWFGIGVTSISGVRDPSSLEYGIQSNFTYKQEGVVKTLYPNITYKGKTYEYAATGTENADKEGYYTLIPARVNIADGANAGNNRYNPTASGKTYHQDYTMVMNEKSIYTVTYNVMDPGETTYGVLNDYSQRVDAGTSESKLNKPTLKDVPSVRTDSAGNKYKFDGWYKDSGCTEKAYFNGKVNANTNYYGKYVAETYTVKYDSNGGTLVADKTLKYNDVVDTSQTPTKEGYIFVGWYYGSTKVTNQKYATLAKSESKKEIILEAHWKENLKASAEPVVKTYDGNAYGVNVKTNVKDATIRYWNKNTNKYDLTESPTKTNVTRDTDGNIKSLTVKYEVSKKGYKTVYGEATVTITPRQVTLRSSDAKKEYDGTALTKDEVKVTSGSFADKEGYTATTSGSQTLVGTSANKFNYELNKGTKAANYEIKTVNGTLEVTAVTDEHKHEAVVQAPSNEDTYDGTEKSAGTELTGTTFPWKGQTYRIEGLTSANVTKTDAGEYENKVNGTAKVLDTAGNDVTAQFKVTKKSGKLVINPKEYTVTTDSATKTYSGTALTAGGKVEGIVSGETVEFTTTGSQTEVGTSKNTYELVWKSAKATNYTLAKESIGILKVKKQSIDPGTDPEKPNPDYTGAKVNSPSDKVYDGKEHKWIPTVTDKADKKLKAGTDYTVEYSTSDFTNVGTIKVTITGKGNYSGTVKRSYKVTPKEYTVTTDSATKTYSGTALTAGGKVEGIVSGETVEFTTTGSQTEVGTSKNTYELVWKSAKATNYTLVKESIGTLTVKAKSIVPDGPDTPDEKKTGITVSEPSDSKYDGKEHKEVLTVTDTKTGKELVAGTDYSVTYSSDLVNAGTVKVTVAGLGNYTGSFTKTYKITKRSVTLTSATVSKVYDGSALTNTSITVSGDGFVEGEGASYEVTGTQTEVGNSANAFEYKLNEKTLASNYNITKVVGTLTITAAPAPVTPATPSTPSSTTSTTSTTPRTPSAPQVTTPAETVEKETTPKAEPKKEEKVEEEYTPKASPQYYWALINLICAILTVLFGLLLLISKRHKSEDDDEEDNETKQQTNNDDEEKEQEKKRGLFTRVLAVLIAIVSVVFFLVTEDLSLPWTWTDQWTIWMVVIGLVQIVVFFVGRKWKNVDNDDDDEEAQQA